MTRASSSTISSPAGSTVSCCFGICHHYTRALRCVAACFDRNTSLSTVCTRIGEGVFFFGKPPPQSQLEEGVSRGEGFFSVPSPSDWNRKMLARNGHRDANARPRGLAQVPACHADHFSGTVVPCETTKNATPKNCAGRPLLDGCSLFLSCHTRALGTLLLSKTKKFADQCCQRCGSESKREHQLFNAPRLAAMAACSARHGTVRPDRQSTSPIQRSRSCQTSV